MAGKRAKEVQRQINALPEGPARSAAQAAYNQAMVPTGKGTGKLSVTERDNILNIVSAGANVTGGGQQDALDAYRREMQRQFDIEQANKQEVARQSAYDLARAFAEEYGIGASIADRIIDLVAKQGYTQTAVRLELQNTPEYKARFKGIELYKQNFASDISAGSKAAALTPADYIKAEKEYQEILTRYGLGDLGNQDTYAELIGGDVSAVELKDRVENVYDRIQNADDVLKEQLKTYFPQLEEADFAKALLTGRSPDDMANSLKRRVSQAEISSEAARAGLGGLSVERAEQLAAMGLTRTIARAGYSRIAEQQSRLGTLADIYGTSATGLQEELEAEQFQGLASQRRKQLTEQEKATFSGRSGISQVSLQQRTTGQF